MSPSEKKKIIFTAFLTVGEIESMQIVLFHIYRQKDFSFLTKGLDLGKWGQLGRFFSKARCPADQPAGCF